MSTVNVELLLDRLRSELDRFGSIAEASRRIGEKDSLGLRDVCNGRKRLTAELLAKLAEEGVDALYVLTGQRGVRSAPLSEAARDALALRGLRVQPGAVQEEVEISPVGLMWFLNYHRSLEEGGGEPLMWGNALLERLAAFEPEGPLRPLNLQAVNLKPHDDKAYPQLLIYLAQTPPHTPWSLAPSEGVKTEYELDLGLYTLPLRFPETDYPAPRLVLSEDEVKRLLAGEVCRYAAPQPSKPR